MGYGYDGRASCRRGYGGKSALAARQPAFAGYEEGWPKAVMAKSMKLRSLGVMRRSGALPSALAGMMICIRSSRNKRRVCKSDRLQVVSENDSISADSCSFHGIVRQGATSLIIRAQPDPPSDFEPKACRCVRLPVRFRTAFSPRFLPPSLTASCLIWNWCRCGLAKSCTNRAGS